MIRPGGEDVVLHGGVANAGAVVRRGDHVLRPSNAHTATIHRFLNRLGALGFDGASLPVGVEPDGRERMRFIAGDVPVPPYPDWAQSDSALVSLADLMRRYHEAARAVGVEPGDVWSNEMADEDAAASDNSVLVVCHNDVCLENVVFREGRAVALIDFDFAAPGRPLFDLAAMVRMCVPIDDPSGSRFGWRPADLPARLRLVADAYGLDAAARHELLQMLHESLGRGGQFMQRRVDAGDVNFTEIWNASGGMARFDRRRAWWRATRPEFAAAMG